MKKTKGITLIALVVTIVVLLILAGITIVYVFGDKGVFGKALDAKIATELGKIEEQADLIYANKFLKNKGEKVPNREIIDELINNGNQIEIRNVGVAAITGIKVEPSEIKMNENQTAMIEVKIEGPEDGDIYYAVIDGKYYQINFSDSKMTIEREATKLEENVVEPPIIEIETGYDTTIVKKAEINQSDKTIEIGSGTKYGTTKLKVKYGTKTEECTIEVTDETNWAEMNEIARAIAKDSTITSNSSSATVMINGVSKTVSVGGEYKVKYAGRIRKVRVLGFKHDDLVDQGVYRDGINHEKASISFEFLTFMTTNESNLSQTMSMNDNNTNSGGWGACKMRRDLNGYTNSLDEQEGLIGGLGTNLSNKSYIKQVKKQYIQKYDDPESVSTSQDYLWLLSCSEMVSAGDREGYFGSAVTKEGERYKYYQGVTEWFSSRSEGRKKGTGIGSSSDFKWWLRSTDFFMNFYFAFVASDRISDH